jgi:hypothetical protein
MKSALLLTGLVMFLAALACSFGGTAAPSAPLATVAPITLGSDLGKIDVCRAVPRETMEALLGRKLATPPEPFAYGGEAQSSGCAYDGGKDSAGNAVFGYVAFTPASVYASQPLSQKADVAGIGQSAYFTNGADARQLWVKVNERVALVAAFGDKPNEEGTKKLAALLLEALK